MKYKLHLGNCLEVMPALGDRVDAIITSPPYFNARDYSQFDSYDAYLGFLGEFANAARQALKPCCIFAVNLSCVIEPRLSRGHESRRLPIPFDFVGIAINAGFKFLDEIIWQKPDGASNRARAFSYHRRPVAYKPHTVTEFVLIFKNGEGLLDGVINSHSREVIGDSLVIGEYERTNVWELPTERVAGHPAPFPLGLAARLVRYYSYKGDTILDPFLGSGTSGIAALRWGRNFVGIEKQPDYLAIAKKRIEEEAARLPLF